MAGRVGRPSWGLSSSNEEIRFAVAERCHVNGCKNVAVVIYGAAWNQRRQIWITMTTRPSDEAQRNESAFE